MTDYYHPPAPRPPALPRQAFYFDFGTREYAYFVTAPRAQGFQTRAVLVQHLTDIETGAPVLHVEMTAAQIARLNGIDQ